MFIASCKSGSLSSLSGSAKTVFQFQAEVLINLSRESAEAARLGKSGHTDLLAGVPLQQTDAEGMNPDILTEFIATLDGSVCLSRLGIWPGV